jgi:Flp pilus assembly protein TadB
MFKIFFILVIGFLSNHRILQRWRSKKIITDTIFVSISLLAGIFFVFVLIFSLESSRVAWLAAIFGNTLSLFVPFIVEKRRKRDFESQAVHVMDAIILSVKSGKPLREALSVLRASSSGISFYFTEIVDAIELQQQATFVSKDKKVRRMYEELLFISQSCHRTIEKLEAFRTLLRTEEWFQKKTRQALLQSRAQSVVVGLMYFAVLVYTLLRDGPFRNLDIIGYSSLLLTFGTIWIWKMGSRYRWKV